jgi:hypothetical protein
MITKENEVLGTTAHGGQIAREYNLPKRMDRCQSIGVDEYLLNIRTVWLQFVDQLVGRATVKVSIKVEMNAVFVLELENFKVHGHRLPSFLPPVSGVIRLPQIAAEKTSSHHKGGNGEAARTSCQPSHRPAQQTSSTISSSTFIQRQLPLHTSPIKAITVPSPQTSPFFLIFQYILYG